MSSWPVGSQGHLLTGALWKMLPTPESDHASSKGAVRVVKGALWPKGVTKTCCLKELSGEQVTRRRNSSHVKHVGRRSAYTQALRQEWRGAGLACSRFWS